MDVTDHTNYKTWRKDRSMHSDEGTTFQEVIGLIVPSFFYTVICTILKSILLNIGIDNKIFHFIVEFTIIVIPNILQVTVLEQYVFSVFIGSFFMMLVLLITIYDGGSKYEKAKSNSYHSYLTNSRSTINLISVIAILAVDFSIFPKRFYKTENFGISLMDVGAALYITGNGMVAPEVKGRTETVKSSFKSSLPIFVLGIGRFFSVVAADYYVPVTEYGLHWNFFITIGVVKLCGSIILLFVKKYLRDRIGLTGLFIVILHEILLKLYLESYVFGESSRANFVDANKEGIVSSIGYLAIYLLMIHFMRVINNKRNQFKTIFLYGTIYFIAAIVLNQKNGICRKVANAGFCFWIMFLVTLMVSLFYIWENIQNKLINTRKPCYEPELFRAINYNPLVFFLLANILTGVINMKFNTIAATPIIGLIIITLYMLVNCLTSSVLYYRNISVLKIIRAR